MALAARQKVSPRWHRKIWRCRSRIQASRLRTRASFVVLGREVPAPDERLVGAGTELALGAVVVLFAVTFGALQFFSSSLKEEESWQSISQALQERGLQSLGPEGVEKAVGTGAVLVDVRQESEFEQGRAKGSVNIPLYQGIDVQNGFDLLRKAAFFFFGLSGTERNPAWEEEVRERLPRNRDIIVACEMGGSLQPSVASKFGTASRSLKAAKKLQDMGYRRVKHLAGGLSQWRREGRGWEE